MESSIRFFLVDIIGPASWLLEQRMREQTHHEHAEDFQTLNFATAQFRRLPAFPYRMQEISITQKDILIGFHAGPRICCSRKLTYSDYSPGRSRNLSMTDGLRVWN
jgi:hypothetical protein